MLSIMDIGWLKVMIGIKLVEGGRDRAAEETLRWAVEDERDGVCDR